MRYAIAVLVATLVTPTVRADEKTFDSNGVKIAYVDEGKGEVVVLLHGFAASAAEMWTNMPLTQTQLLPVLAKDYRVIAPDLRGHGKSDKPHDPKKYGKEVVEDVIRLLDHLKIKKAHVVGYSMGASVAGKLLASHPDRLLSVTFGGGAPQLKPTREFVAVIAATAESLEKEKGIGPLVIALTPEGQEKPSAEEAAALGSLFLLGKDQKALAAILRGAAESQWEVSEAELKANTVPVQFVYGSRESKFLTDPIAAAKKLLPKAGTVVVEKGDHMTTFIAPEFRKAVLDFLKANKDGK